MLKRLIMTASLVGLMLAGSPAWADSQDQRVQRNLRTLFGLVVEPSSRGGQEEVPSPTFTLVQIYDLDPVAV